MTVEVNQLPPMTPVVSSHIDAVGYQGPTRQLFVKFHNEDTYVYADVPPELHAKILDAPSVGGFLAAHVKPQFKSQKVEVKHKQ